MDYCDIVYMCTSESNLQHLQQVQNCACRIILRADRLTSTNEMHQTLDLQTLKQRRMIHLAMDCYTNITVKESGLHKLFKQVDSNRNRRTRSTNTNQLEVSNIRTVTGRKAYSFRVPMFWNSIDSDTRQIENKNQFKTHITKLVCRDVNHPT